MWSQQSWDDAMIPAFMEMSAKLAAKVAGKNTTIIDADDLHQEVLIAAAEGRFGHIERRLDEEPAFLYGDVKNFLLDSTRTEVSRSSKSSSYEKLVEEAYR